jgi:cation diffusion facilitator family transporter
MLVSFARSAGVERSDCGKRGPVNIQSNYESHHVSYDRGMRSSLVGLAANLALAVGKLVAGVLGRSHALIADATESLGDVFGSLVVWRGLQIAKRPPDANHPYGHGKAEPIAAALVAILLVAAGVVIAIQSVHEIARPRVAPRAFTLFVLVGVVLIKEGLFRFVIRVGERTRSNAVGNDAWHHRSDAITSAAAAVGIAISLIGGPGYAAADDWAALFASGIILFTGVRLLRPSIAELMDQSPPAGLVEETRQVAEALPGVHRVEKVLMRKMGLYYVADMHLEVEPTMTVWESHEIAHGVKEAVRGRMSQIVEVTIHVEPAYPPASVIAEAAAGASPARRPSSTPAGPPAP